MRKLCRVDIGRLQEVFQRITGYSARVVQALDPAAVLLFGSFARGDVNEGSDVDILVIADFTEPFLDRIKLLLDLNDEVKLPLEPVGYTPEEFARLREAGSPFIMEILKGSVVLHGQIPEPQPPSSGASPSPNATPCAPEIR